MKEEPVSFASQGLRLQGLLFRPPEATALRGAVVCHPHPLYGGSMHNNVVEAILEAVRALGCATLRFNFRGVGNSDGEYDDGRGEAVDAAAAVRFLTGLTRIQRDRVILAGYSFGALVAASAGASLPEVSTVIAVAPPIATGDPSPLANLGKRLVLIAAEHDRFCPPARLEALRLRLAGLAALETIAGADHFFAGQEADVTAALIEALKQE